MNDDQLTRPATIGAARARRTPWNWGWLQLGAVAASLAIGLVVGSQTGNTPAGETGALVVATADGPTLGGGLETFLAATKSGERKQLASLGTASVTISFMTAEGKLCRQFAIEGKTRTTDGVACRAQRGWRVEALGLRAGDTGEMRTASGDAAPAVISTVDALIAGDPLDAAAEAKALSVE